MTFREDDARARKDNSPLNLNILRKRALALLNSADMGKRVSLRRKMYRAAMDSQMLRQVVFPEMQMRSPQMIVVIFVKKSASKDYMFYLMDFVTHFFFLAKNYSHRVFW